MSKKNMILLITSFVLSIANLGFAVNFGPNSATLTNPYFPMKAGDKLIYTSYGFDQVYEFEWEPVIEVVDNIEC